MGLISSLNLHGQENFKHDIGITLSTLDHQRIGLDYRLKLNDHWKFRIGGAYGNRYSNVFNRGVVSTVTDSLITFRKHQSESTTATLKLGTERRFGQSMFSVSADILLSYQNYDFGYSNSFSELDTNGLWISQTRFQSIGPYSFTGDTTSSRITRHYLLPGLMLGANMDIPIKKRFVLSLNASGILRGSVFLKSTNLHDPYDEFSKQPGSIINFDTALSATIRYRFGLEE